MHQNTFGGHGLRPGPLGELMRSPIPLSHNGGLLLRGGRGRDGGKVSGPTYKGAGVEKGGEGIPPKVKVSIIDTAIRTTVVGRP